MEIFKATCKYKKTLVKQETETIVAINGKRHVSVKLLLQQM